MAENHEIEVDNYEDLSALMLETLKGFLSFEHANFWELNMDNYAEQSYERSCRYADSDIANWRVLRKKTLLAEDPSPVDKLVEWLKTTNKVVHPVVTYRMARLYIKFQYDMANSMGGILGHNSAVRDGNDMAIALRAWAKEDAPQILELYEKELAKEKEEHNNG